MSNYPTVRPSLTLDFQKSKQLDPRISFSRSSTATYVEGGVVKYADEHQARFEEEGLLIEEARTNVISNSSSPTWGPLISGTGVTPVVTAVSDVAPDGTTNSVQRFQFDRGTGNTTNDFSLVFNTINGVASSLYANTVWLKSNDTNNYTIQLYDPYGQKGEEFVITPTWQRFKIDSSTSYKNSNPFANTQAGLGVGLRNSPGNSNYYTGDNNSQIADILAWGPQIEAGSFPTSYIPTSGSTVTRAADVASITGTNFSSWYNQSEGSTLINYNAPNAIIDTDYPRLFAFNSGFATDFSAFAFNGANNSMFVNYVTGSSTKLSVSTTLPENSNGTAALAYQDNNSIAFLNENSSTQGRTAGPMSTILNRLDIGGDSAFSSRILNGHISRLTYYSERLTDTQLEAITS